jgi:hypothetical protein
MLLLQISDRLIVNNSLASKGAIKHTDLITVYSVGIIPLSNRFLERVCYKIQLVGINHMKEKAITGREA